MKAIEKAARADLRLLPAELASSALGRAVIDLARRLDERPADTAAVLIVRELRLAMATLRGQAGKDTDSDLDAFLEAVATPAFSGPGD